MSGKILLAEDEGSLRDTLAEALREAGYDVVPAANGQAALDALGADQFGLLILDCLMPKVAGFDVAKAFRARDTETPIIFMSGIIKSPDQQREARDRYGSRGYLTKPFELPRLLEAVRAALPPPDAAPPPPLPSEGTLLEAPALHLLWRAQKELHTGILELYGERERARVFVFKGRAALAQHSDPQLNVGIELVREGVLSADLYTQSAELAVQRGIGLYDVLKAEGFATEADARAAYKQLIPKVLERVVGMSGQFRWIATDAFNSIILGSSVPILEPLFAGLRKVGERELDPHITPRRPLRLAPGDNWSDMVGRLIEACGSDSITRAINGRATIAQLIEAAGNANERNIRFRQVYLLMSTMAVRASLEPIPMTAAATAEPAAPRPAQAPASSAGSSAGSSAAAPAGVYAGSSAATASSSGAVRAAGPAAGTPGPAAAPRAAVIDESVDAGVRFTADEQAARARISAKYDELKNKTYYEVLGVPKGAEAGVVKKAYLVLARDFHTDAFPGLNLGSAQKKLDHVFQTVQTAYSTLTDEKKRGEYDAKLSFEAGGGSSDVIAILEAEAELQKAQRFVERGELSAALKLLDKVVTVMPKNDEALGYQKYCAWWQTKNPATAQQVIRDLELHWKAAPAALALKEFQGWIFMETNDLKAARSVFKKVLDTDPKHAGATRGARQLQRKIEEEEKKGSGLAKLLKR